MPNLEFWSDDCRFGLRVFVEQTSQILRLCIDAKGNEVGGVLAGFYTVAHDCAVVKAISSLPADSRSGKTWFNRGVRGLQVWLDLLWHRQRYYYLGEWHFHPNGVPVPSQVDAEQMKGIACSERYRCPEPVLLIIGGDPLADWTAKAYVFPREHDPAELAQVSVSRVTGAEPISGDESTETEHD